MAQAFLIIIAILGAIYALIQKKLQIALGLLIIGTSFVFSVPNIVSGIWVDVFGALTMIVFALGVFVIIYQKKKITAPDETIESEKSEVKQI